MAKKRNKTKRGSAATKAVTKTADKSKIVKAFALILAILAVAYVITSLAFGGIWNPFKWKSNNTPTDTVQGDTSNDNIAISTYALAAENYAEYGISDDVLSAGILTAEYTPSNTTNKRTDWAFDFAQNAWSEGKVLSDYVRFIAGANHAPECRYEVLQPFGASIIVSATSRANSDLTASTQIEYMIRYNDSTGGAYMGANDEEIELLSVLSPENNTYTILPDYIEYSVTFSFFDCITDNAIEYGYGNTENYEGFFQAPCEDGKFYLADIFEQIPEFNELNFVKFMFDNDIHYLGEFDVYGTCFYGGEEIYSFVTDGTCCIYLTDDWLEAHSIRGTEIELPDKVIV